MYKVLIVEDNYLQIQSLMSYIDWEKFGVGEIRTAQDGKEGLKIFDEYNPDIIITDVVMPVKDGISMVKEIRKTNKKPHIIYMSCYEDFHYIQEAIKNEAISYILKPIRKEELEESLYKLIGHVEHDKKFSAMNTLIKDNIDIHRKNFLCRLIYTRNVERELVNEERDILEFNKYKGFIAAKTEVVNIKDIGVDIFTILDMTEKHLLKTEEAFAVAENGSRIVTVFMDKNGDSEYFLNHVKTRFGNFASLMKRRDGIILETGISTPYKVFDGKSMLAGATAALEDNLSVGGDDIAVADGNGEINIIEDIMELKTVLNNVLNAEDSKAELENFLDTYCVESAYFNKYHIRTFGVSVFTVLQLLLYERVAEVNNLFHNLNIMNNLNMLENVKDLRWILEKIILAAIESIKSDSETVYDKITAEIKNYINNNFKNIKNIKEIANECYVSESYARKIFKETTGNTIFEFLIAKRMNEAKKLLANPERKVYEIAECVGYNSTQRFIDTFRQHTGMLPKEYRNKTAGKGVK